MAKKKSTVSMPVLALRGLMVFPHMVLHFDVGRTKSVAALEEAMMGNQKVFLVAQQMPLAAEVIGVDHSIEPHISLVDNKHCGIYTIVVAHLDILTLGNLS